VLHALHNQHRLLHLLAVVTLMRLRMISPSKRWNCINKKARFDAGFFIANSFIKQVLSFSERN
jgi:hypothetical protein